MNLYFESQVTENMPIAMKEMFQQQTRLSYERMLAGKQSIVTELARLFIDRDMILHGVTEKGVQIPTPPMYRSEKLRSAYLDINQWMDRSGANFLLETYDDRPGTIGILVSEKAHNYRLPTHSHNMLV